MMNPPKTRFVEHGGLNIAYQVVGDGPVDLLFVPGWISNVDLFWESKLTARFFERLSSFVRVIPYDKPGTGLSDPVDTIPPLEERVDQVVAVLDAAESERAFVLGLSEGAITAALIAAARPERVSGLILLNGCPGLDRRTDELVRPGLHTQMLATVEDIVRHWGQGTDAARWVPSLAQRPDIEATWGRVQRACSTRATARRYLETATDLSAWEILPVIRHPTLVMHRRGDRIISNDYGRAMAERIRDAEFVELDGDDHLPWVGDADAVLDAIRRFVGAEDIRSDDERVLATLLFTDLVASTDRLSSMGDASWRACLEDHDRIASDVVEGERGRIVKSTGDGILAVFDGPARAVRGARSLLGELAAAGLPARAGLHTGEIEIRGDDVAGLAVHIAARVMGTAGEGEVLVSRTVRDLVAGSGLSFEPRGAHALKGIPEEWELFAAA